jgi:release factor glutamine methyltransferase
MEFAHQGVRLSVPDDVYNPAEDSFMLADAAAKLRGGVLEIGCGSGFASLCCAKAARTNKVLGVDIAPQAVNCARDNAKMNNIKNASFLSSDLFSRVPEKKFDAVIFNPPYLPTSGSDWIAGPLNHAFNGGKDGREVVDRFLARFDAFLRPGGVLLLVQSSLNDLEKTKKRLKGLGYSVRTIKQEKFFFERLYLIRAVKP